MSGPAGDPGAGAPTDEAAARAEASADFGRLRAGRAAAVIAPASIEEAQAALRQAAARGVPVTARGRGLSQGGQSIPDGGASLSLRRLDRVSEPDARAATVRCQAGASFRQVVDACAPRGLLPRVLPLNLDLSIGGVLSVGGVGATSHRFGPVVANAPELEVLTADGERRRCGAEHARPLFDAVLAGLGRCGLIAEATLALRPFRPRVRTYFLLYDDVGRWLADQRMLIAEDRVDYLEGFASASVQGLRTGPAGRAPFATWLYVLQVSVEHAPGRPPATEEILAGLGHWRLTLVDDDDTAAFAARYDARFAAMRRTGAWRQAHPWVEGFLPLDRAAELVPALLDALPLFLGDAHRLMFVGGREPPPLFVLPHPPPVPAFAVLPVGVPPPLLDDALAALERVHRAIVDAGGKRYLSGWLGEPDDAAWRAHYGARYPAWRRAGRELDPGGVFGSVLYDRTGRREGR